MDDVEAFERERDSETRRRITQEAEELDRRERELDERRRREGFPPAGPPHHSSAGSIPIHQPVASRIAGAIHSPGGLLANHGSAAPPIPLGAPSGPPANFGGPLQPDAGRPPPHAGAPNPPAQHQMFAPIAHTQPPSNNAGPPSGHPPPFGGPMSQRETSQALQQVSFGPGGAGPAPGQPQNQMQGGQNAGGLAQGQQPILNVSIFFCSVSLCFACSMPSSRLCQSWSIMVACRVCACCLDGQFFASHCRHAIAGQAASKNCSCLFCFARKPAVGFFSFGFFPGFTPLSRLNFRVPSPVPNSTLFPLAPFSPWNPSTLLLAIFVTSSRRHD